MTTPTSETAEPLQILMIEDSISFAKLTIAQLELAFSLPHAVRHFDNVTSGLAALGSRPADLIILDLHLPDSHGIDTFRRVKEVAPDTPIVILSSDDSDKTALAAIQQGADGYLVKGVDQRMTLMRTLRFAIEHKRRLNAERELDAARFIQRSLLPSENPNVEGFEIAGAVFPAAGAAGDFFDFVVPIRALGEDTLGIVVADVSGHGYGPAMVMAETHGCLHALFRTETDLGRILELANAVLATNRHSHFVSAFLAGLHLHSRSLVYAAAGHEAWYFPQGGEFRALRTPSLPLGLDVEIEAASDWQSVGPLQLAAGDLLVIATDGVIDSYNNSGEQYGIQRVAAFIQSHRLQTPSKLIELLTEDVRHFAGGSEQNDDITVVIVKVCEP